MPLVLRRIEAVLRRTEQGTEEEPSVIRYKEITLDTENYEVLVGTDEVSLTSREFEILKLLLENPGKCFPGRVFWTACGDMSITGIRRS